MHQSTLALSVHTSSLFMSTDYENHDYQSFYQKLSLGKLTFGGQTSSATLLFDSSMSALIVELNSSNLMDPLAICLVALSPLTSLTVSPCWRWTPVVVLSFLECSLFSS